MKRTHLLKVLALSLATAMLVTSVPQNSDTILLAQAKEDSVQDTEKNDSASGSAVSTTGSAVVPTVTPTATPTATPTSTPLPATTTVVKPSTPTSITVRGGSKRVRVTWAAVSDADGYFIYCRESTSAVYSKVKTITNPETLTYDKTSLVQNATYYFSVSAYKIVDGVTYESALSTAISAKTQAATKTSKTAKKYSSKTKFKNSPAYKKYTAMVNDLNYSKSFAIPGMKNTNVGGFNCTSMVPQGITLAGSYFLITAYDSKGLDYSVIYVVSRASKSYITTIILPSKAKVGGIAYDGTNIWISKGTSVAAFPYTFITDTVNAGVAYKKLSAYTSVVPVLTTASYMGYYDGILWVGSYQTSSSTMYGYKVGSTATVPTLTQTNTMSVPSKTQGITFDSDGTLILTRACGKNPTDSGYISQVRTYLPSYASADVTGKILKNSVRKTTKMPPKTEGVAIYGTYTYVLFSSSHFSKCNYPIDRVLALKTSKLLA